MNSPLSTLFLHGGPGLSSIAERDLYGHTLPIHWWDQPRSVVLFARPFDALIEAAEDEIRMLADTTGRPVDLIAHSFGAHLALRLVARVPAHVGKLFLLAPVYDIGDAFVRLATRLLALSPSSEPLLAALEEFKATSDYARFARLAVQVTSFANLFELYWSAGSATRQRWYLDLLARQSVVDPSAFEVIVRDFWADPLPLLEPVPGIQKVQLVFGREDPLINLATERRIWMQLFPHAQSIELDTGHFIHLEAPASHWWKASAPHA
ncbi:alpha/beta hydrolase [Paraburkholderia sp. J63]|uniref:alpha/beta fold hydrolase n=1 Tax=Paraburkholderia sp. J63 TaxID=2805434 RepID=UPI002ABD5848|nr:alpha/beta hydrolase [Paraburkholderia sp. J63]